MIKFQVKKAPSYMTICKITKYVHGFGCFFCVWRALYVQKILIPTWDETHNLGWPKKLNGPWKLKKFAWNRKRRTWVVTWIKRCRNSLDDAPGIYVGSFELKWVKISNDMEFLNFLLFIKKIEIFEIFYPLSIVLDCFWPFWTNLMM